MSKGKILTADLILTKNKADSLFAIKNLNLWGNDLEVQLTLIQDLKILSEMPNLEVLSLSVNRISSLRDFSMCPHLQVFSAFTTGTVPSQKQYLRYSVDQVPDQAVRAESVVAV